MSRTARLLNARAELWREGRTADGMGGWVSAWAQVGDEPVKARFSQPSATERVVADQSGSDLSHVAYLLPDSGVRRGDELRTPGRIFDVLAVYEPSVSDVYLRADCRVRQTSQ
ncbi:head-tail adaptor protein [Streptomyces sp. NBC_01356]|uniref:head-tail adaptor protein n=1 Tax=Streptomyces sp. NBC_01356 TaxID=2903836 RepID=UPI003FCD4798